MVELYVNHNVSKIQLANPEVAGSLVLVFILIFSLVSVRKRNVSYLDLGTSLVFRGVAILLLLCGHFAEMCLQHDSRLPVDGGFLAVCIFLFLSGYGLVQRYGLEKIGIDFWPNRLLKLFIPLWLTLTVFILLDRLLLNMSHPFWELVLNYCGIMLNGAFVRVNSPAWFVDYILFQYIIFFFLFRTGLENYTKIALQFGVSILVAVCIYFTILFDYFSIWLQYTLVFPFGVLLALMEQKMMLLKTLFGTRAKLFIAVFLLVGSIVAIIIIGKLGPQLGHHPKLLLQQISVLIIVISGGYLASVLEIESKFLVFLGKYSFEIFLLHLPFMVKYDFLLFRKPFVLSCIAYLGVLIFLAVVLQKISNQLRAIIWTKCAS